jgi:polysaccharide export outer membrane protein
VTVPLSIEQKDASPPATVAPPVDRQDTHSPVPVSPDVKDLNAADATKETGTAGPSHRPPLASPTPAARMPPPAPASALGPPGYLIGPNDVLSVTFWRDKEMHSDVLVRPDGNITLPLLNDIQAAGMTPAQLRDRTSGGATISRTRADGRREGNQSRNVFITGQVDKPGSYPLAGPMTVLQLIAMAGGLKEFADSKNIVLMRTENGRQVAFQVDYKELLKRRNLRQNIDLKPGDTVVVP